MVSRNDLCMLLSQFRSKFRITLQIDGAEVVDVAQAEHLTHYFPYHSFSVKWKFFRNTCLGQTMGLYNLKYHVGKLGSAKLHHGTNFEKFFMMRNTIAIALLVFTSVAHAQTNGAGKSGPTKIRHEALSMQGEMAYYQNKPFSGMSFTFWENKQMNELYSWEDGQMHGEYKQFTEKGKLVTLITYNQGTKEGPFEYYYETGAMQSRGAFKRGELHGLIEGFYVTGVQKYAVEYSLGIRNVSSKTWFKNGAPEQFATYTNNLPNGGVFEYYPDSILWSESEFKMGVRHGRYYQFHKGSGCPAVESYYNNGKLDSIRRIWNEVNCMLIEEEHYNSGEKNGEFIRYDFTGDTLSLKNYKYNKLEGAYIEYYQKTKPEIDPVTGLIASYDTKHGREVVGNYTDNQKNGYWYYGLVSNYQHREGNYEGDVMVGHWLFYDLKGRILMEQDYDDDGNIIKEKLYKRPRKTKSK